MKILADIGGTYARFATVNGTALENVQKYEAANFPTIEDALQEYCDEKRAEISIATAAYPDGDTWKFVNKNKWTINAQTLKKAGWTLSTILNDFESATWGLLHLNDQNQNILHAGTPTQHQNPHSLIGPGTGLGLGYLIQTENGPHIQRTHGGHMMATPATDEQWLIAKTIQREQNNKAVVFEHMVSGPGLYNIYSALNLIAGKTPALETPQDMLKHLDCTMVQDAIRLFHEFFGLFARTITITAHAYSGLYLTGGVLEHLKELNLFDFEHFHTYMLLRGVDSVSAALAQTPIIHVTDPHLAMHGLLAYEEHRK